MILQLNPTIDVSTPLGDCEAIFLIDYGVNVNTVWVCRMPGGEVKHFYSDDINIYDNPMNGSGWDLGKELRVNPEYAHHLQVSSKPLDMEWPVKESSPKKFPKGTQDPKGLQEAYEKIEKDIYNPERLPVDGGRNRKKWNEIHESYKYDDRFVFFIKFLDEKFQPPKNHSLDTWAKVYNWYVSLSQYQDKSFLDFLIEFYPAPDPKV